MNSNRAAYAALFIKANFKLVKMKQGEKDWKYLLWIAVFILMSFSLEKKKIKVWLIGD